MSIIAFFAQSKPSIENFYYFLHLSVKKSLPIRQEEVGLQSE